jgi:hypothetical protein
MELFSIWMRSSTNKQEDSNVKGISHKQQAQNRRLYLAVVAGLLLVVLFFGYILIAVNKPRPRVYIKKYRNGSYRMFASGKPYVVKGVCYNPIPVGLSHDYDWWSDPYKPWMVDGKLMKEMGINTIRIYQTGEKPENVKQVIRELYDNFGIRTIVGHWLGFWEYPCPLYGDEEFQSRIGKEVLDMVNEYKDEPGVLCWILGNENNYSCLGSVNPWSSDDIDKEPDLQKRRVLRNRIYYSFVNDLAKKIHAIDPEHPVGLGNGELIGLDSAQEYASEVDMVACIIYRGKTFGNLFKSLKATFDKPILLSEFGADAYDAYLKKEDQNMQAFFLESLWRQIYENLADNKKGAGNCLGGVMFEWTDEWWKHNSVDPESWKIHDTESNWSNGSYYFDIKAPKNMNMNEEWFGIIALSADQKDFGLDMRVPRKAYYVIRDFWNNPKVKARKQRGKSK